MIRRQLGATFLIAGTCIGGGMLALPVTTGGMGFLPSVFVMLLVWVMMTLSALLYLEVCLNMKPGTHIVTMSAQLLGNWVKGANGFIFAFVSYASLTAYVYAGGQQIATKLAIEPFLGHLLFLLAFGIFLHWKTSAVERLNSIIFCGMLVAYAMLLGIGHDDVNIDLLSHSNWRGLTPALPIILTSFSFQAFLIPSLTDYLRQDGRALRQVLVGGTTLTLLFYLIWQWLVLGTVPCDLLETARANGDPATYYFSHAVSSPLVARIAEAFAFFAVTTSFLGMALGLQDFLSDTFSIKKNRKGLLVLTLLILAPTFLAAEFFEKVFTTALDATGGFGDTIINGLIPVALVWVLRYHRNLKSEYRLPFGKPLLVIVFLFYLGILLDSLTRGFLG
jgi:tyrosine-specific transport protein